MNSCLALASCHHARFTERYLWDDSLYLIQDDEEELRQCGKVMDAFYARATLTIIAASDMAIMLSFQAFILTHEKVLALSIRF